MDIIFINERSANEFNDSQALTRRYGADTARRIRQRLDDLRAAANLSDMRHLPGRLHPLAGHLAGLFALDLRHPLRLLLEPANEPLPLNDAGTLDWQQVTCVRVLRVEDYHG